MRLKVEVWWRPGNEAESGGVCGGGLGMRLKVEVWWRLGNEAESGGVVEAWE